MSDKKMRIALFGNVYKREYSSVVLDFFSLAVEYGISIAVQKAYYDFLVNELGYALPSCEVIGDERLSADMVVCMGGDGTFLDVAGRVGDKQIPILGINTGRLGFLASFSPEDIKEVVNVICTGNYSVHNHSVLQLSCDDMDLQGYPFALNEIAILKHDIASMISISTHIDGEYLTTYQADGLIVGTPTGSTAYSLSVGGPIIVPQSDTISLTPVAPHSLNVRPIVLCDNSEIEICVESRSHNFLVSIDGRSCSYPDRINLRIKRAPYVVKVVTRKGQGFFSTLRRKMMWGADNRE